MRVTPVPANELSPLVPGPPPQVMAQQGIEASPSAAWRTSNHSHGNIWINAGIILHLSPRRPLSLWSPSMQSKLVTGPRSAFRFTILICLLATQAIAAAPSYASINVSPTSGPPGTTVTVNGSGFAPGFNAEIRWDGATLELVHHARQRVVLAIDLRPGRGRRRGPYDLGLQRLRRGRAGARPAPPRRGAGVLANHGTRLAGGAASRLTWVRPAAEGAARSRLKGATQPPWQGRLAATIER